MLGLNWFAACISKHKAPSSIGILDLAWLEQVAETGRLLVTEHTTDGHAFQLLDALDRAEVAG